MIFSKDEINLIYINRLIDRLLSEDKKKFKNRLSKLSLESKIYRFKDFSYTYGHSEIFGYYFIAINDDKEGFMWINPPQFEQNENGLFYGTNKFNYLEEEFYSVFNYTKFREIYIGYIRDRKLENNIQTFLSIIMFRSFPWLKRFNRRISAKVIGAYIFSIIYNFKNEVNLLNKELENFNLIQTENFINQENIIKASTFTTLNIEKIIKKEISFIDIIDNIY